MPQNVQIGTLALGGILVLIGILGGAFTIFGASIAEKVSNPILRIFSFLLGAGLVGMALLAPPTPPYPPGNVTTPNNPQQPDLTSQISQAETQLASSNLATRLSGIHMLQTIGSGNSDIARSDQQMIIDILQRFIKQNINDRKTAGAGILEDRGTFRADDITDSFKALQAVRRASGATLAIDLNNTNFDHVNLTELDLEGFNFSHSSFQYAFLSGSSMVGANFNFADLSHSAIWNADMSRATFQEAILFDTRFANVDLLGSNIEQAADRNVSLFGVDGLTQAQYDLFPRRD